MWEYFTCFTLSSLIAFTAGRGGRVLESKVRAVALILAICAPVVLLAALRDYTIGTDVQVYGIYSYSLAQGRSLFEYISLVSSEFEIAYMVLVWAISNMFQSIPALLGAIALCATAPVVVACFKLSPRYAWLGLTLYYLMFFGATLNYLRQGMALGFVILAAAYLIKEKPVGYFFSSLLAICFHQTAILSLPVLVIYWIEMGRNNLPRASKGSFLLKALVLIVALCVVVFGDRLVLLFSSAKDSYSAQVTRLGQGGISLSITAILFLIILVLCMHQLSRSCEPSSQCSFLVHLALLGFIFRFLTVWQGQLERVALYYLVFIALAAPLVASNLKEKDAVPFGAALLLLSMLYFLTYYINLGFSEIYPYVINPLIG